MDKSLSFATLVQPKTQAAGTANPKAPAADPNDPSFDFLAVQASSSPPPPLSLKYYKVSQQQPSREDNYGQRPGQRGPNGGRMSVDSRQSCPRSVGRRSLDSGTGTGRRTFGQVAPEEWKRSKVKDKKKSQGFLGSMFSGCRECRADDPAKFV